MCKYCKFTYNSGLEESNDLKTIKVIKDGSLTTELQIFRYRTESDQTNELIVERYVGKPPFVTTIGEDHIAIKYCPFCGEKL